MKRLTYVCLCVPLVSAFGVSPVHAATGKVVRVDLTSVWSTPSPDPMGITYDPRTHRLLIADSEVDEMPGLWKGRNLFVVKRKGNLASSRTLKKFTVEPCDVTLATGDRALYVADDDRDRIFRDRAGKDGLFGTRDDVVATCSGRVGSDLRSGRSRLGASRPDADRDRRRRRGADRACLHDPSGEGPPIRHVR